MDQSVTLNKEDCALDALPHGVMVLDKDYRYVFVNAEAERFLDRRREELVGSNHWDLFASGRGTVMDREYRRAFATGKRVRFRYFHSAWRTWFDLTAKLDGSSHLVVSIQDTTDLCKLGTCPGLRRTEALRGVPECCSGRRHNRRERLVRRSE